MLCSFISRCECLGLTVVFLAIAGSPGGAKAADAKPLVDFINPMIGAGSSGGIPSTASVVVSLQRLFPTARLQIGTWRGRDVTEMGR
jgi:hypothetical protein